MRFVLCEFMSEKKTLSRKGVFFACVWSDGEEGVDGEARHEAGER